MGCFSWLCKECGKGVCSDSFGGEMVKLFLLKDGKVIQRMEGEYNSYGAVFTKSKKGFPHSETYKSWKMDWNDVCDLMFNTNSGDGIAAIHSRCWKGKVPKTVSEDDPNQGWGKNWEYF